MLMHAPFGNSYRRFNMTGLAPRYVSWGEDNRTVMVRVAGNGASRRLELRVPGAGCNPYLALAAAGIAGIVSKTPLRAPVSGDALASKSLDVVPLDLTEAVAAFERSHLAREAFGQPVCEHIRCHARHELARFRAEVTDRDLLRGFEGV